MIEIKKGLDLPIEGSPRQELGESPRIRTVAVIGGDYHGMKPTMAVSEGDRVVIGQELFSDKKNPGVIFTSPGAGEVISVNRGDKRVLQSVVIRLDDSEESKDFDLCPGDQLGTLSAEKIETQLIESGLWVSLKTRPYSKAPSPGSRPAAIFVNALDSNPLAAYPNYVINLYKRDFEHGLQVLSKLTQGKLYLCKDSYLKHDFKGASNLQEEVFGGVHPYGLSGTHIHYLEPVSANKTVWSVNYQDVIAIGKLFTEGKLWVERIISLAGPKVKDPALMKVRLGASTEDLTAGRLLPGDLRVVSGSVLSGRHAVGPYAYLDRFALQVSVLEEGRKRVFLGWQRPGFDKFSVKNVFAAKMIPGGTRFPFSTSTEGSERAMVPVGSYEKVMPIDTEPTFLLRSILTQDGDQAILLGALEMDEEDLGLCSFVCPGKVEYGPLLRKLLTVIEREG